MELLQNIPLEGLIPGGKDYNNFQPDRFKQLQAVDGLVTYYHNHFLHFYRYTDGTPNLLAKHDVGTYMALFGEDSGYKEDTPLHTIMGQPGCFWLKLKDQIVVADLLTPHINVQIAINPDWEGSCSIRQARVLLSTNRKKRLSQQAKQPLETNLASRRAPTGATTVKNWPFSSPTSVRLPSIR